MNSTTRYRLVLLLTALFCGPAREGAAQDASITGRIVDVDSGDSLPGVNVFLDQTTRGAATTKDGTYKIPGLHPGSYRIVASIVGYGMESKSIEIVP